MIGQLTILIVRLFGVPLIVRGAGIFFGTLALAISQSMLISTGSHDALVRLPNAFISQEIWTIAAEAGAGVALGLFLILGARYTVRLFLWSIRSRP